MPMLKLQQQPMLKHAVLPKIPQNRIPVIRTVTTRTNDLTERKNEPFPFDKTIKFLSDSHTTHLIDRRIRLYYKLCRCHSNGYIIRDLLHLMKILNILADQCQQQTLYIDPFINVLNSCSKPFLLEKSTDTEIYASALAAYYSDFGYLLRVPDKRIQQCVLQALYKVIQPKAQSQAKEDTYDGLQPASPEFLLHIQCSSDLCETLVQALSLVENDVSLRISIVKLLQIYTSKHPHCISRMLLHDCINRITSRMNDPDPSGELLFRTIELLWNLLDNGDEEQICTQLNSRVTLSLLKEAFFDQVAQSHCQRSRQLRNDILVVCSIIISMNPNAPVIETGFAKQLLLLAAYPELRSNSPLLRNFKLTTCDEDFELKRLLLNVVVILSRIPAMNELIISSRVLSALLSYVKPLSTKQEQLSNAFEWNTAQYEELQLQALAVLSIVLPNSLNEYFHYATSTRLLLFFEWTINNDGYKSQGNSFFDQGGRNSKRSQLKYVLRLIRSLVATKDQRIYVDLCDQGIIPSITGYLRRITQEKSAHLDYLDVDAICDGLFILSCLAELDIQRKELFGSEGIETLIALLMIDPSHVCGGLGHHRLIIATIDGVWCCIIGSVLNEDEFIQKQGVFALLDLIEKNPKSLQNIILGCSLDLAENSKCLHFIRAWQGHKKQSFSHLLCELWRDEERETYVSRTKDGVISDSKKPLMGLLQQSVPLTPLQRFEPSRAILDLIDNMRSKIYGFFCKLGFSELQGLEDQDYITLCIIENFLDFKLGEVWQEILEEIDIEGFQLLPGDSEATGTILRATEERALAVTATQNYIVEQYHRQDLEHEKMFYDELVNNYLFQEKRVEQWRSYVARTSKYPLLMVAKDSQNQAIQQSRLEEKIYSGFHTVHNLEIPNLSITAFTGPFLKIESTPLEILQRK